MTPAERMAIKSVLAELQPAVAVELGTAQGGSLRWIAAACGHVHSFDISEPPSELSELGNVTFHTGDSHELLPRVLGTLADEGTNVDFALVDGDHSAAGVRRDLEDLLDSEAVSRTVILVHDTANPEVRAGLDSVDFASREKLSWVQLDWVPGFAFEAGPYRGQAWAGLGILLVDSARQSTAGPSIVAPVSRPPAAST